MTLFHMDSVCKTYGQGETQVQAVRDVSIQLDAGAFAAVRGPSGCGKTTLLLIAGALLCPDSGSVHLSGHSLYAMSVEKRAAFRATTLGFVFQQFHLIPYLTVLQNVALPALGGGRQSRRARSLELLARFNMSHRAHHLPGELSTGERQRVAMARAMINRPPLLLADEPTGNLDDENAAAVLDALEAYADDGGGVLLVTHDEKAAARATTRLKMTGGTFVNC